MTLPEPGRLETLAPGLARLCAPNASAMTLQGTNSYLVGTADLAVIDPGPDDESHLQALLAGIAERPLRAILVTHAHADHSALAPRLSRATGAPVLGAGPAGSGRSPVMRDLLARGDLAPGPGLDAGHAPDLCLAPGETVSGTDWSIEVLPLPGHTGDHLAFALGGDVLSGDLVFTGSTSVIAPPEGDLDAFLASCARLADRRPARLWPGHGPAIPKPAARLQAVMAHRRDRSAQIVRELGHGPRDLTALTEAIYPDLAPSHRPAARLTVFAHLVSLTSSGRIKASPRLSPDARFRLP